MLPEFFRQKLLGAFVKTNGALSKPLLGGIAHVFMLHRILPKAERDAFTINRSLAITPEALEKWILFFKNAGYECISVDELYLRITENRKPRKKCIVFTIDDGYRDNLVHGLPVFEKHGVPFALFVTSCFPDRTAVFWWYLLEHQFTQHRSITVDDGGVKRTFSWDGKEEADRICGTVRNICVKYDREQFHRFVHESIIGGEQINAGFQTSLPLSWDEITRLSRHPLVTIGAHTRNHLSLRYQEQPVIYDEIESNKKEIEKHIGKPVLHFAYPYGSHQDISQEVFAALKETGFIQAFYNETGSIFKNADLRQFAVPRMGLTDETDHERIRHFLTGIAHFRQYGFKKSIIR